MLTHQAQRPLLTLCMILFVTVGGTVATDGGNSAALTPPATAASSRADSPLSSTATSPWTIQDTPDVINDNGDIDGVSCPHRSSAWESGARR